MVVFALQEDFDVLFFRFDELSILVVASDILP
jgi:hypothetical protein